MDSPGPSFSVVRRDTLRGDEIVYDSDATDDEIEIERPDRIHQRLSKEEIEQLRLTFKNHPKQKLGFDEFRDALAKLDINFTDREFKNFFLKINQNRDFKCDWDELASYLIFGFKEDDSSSSKEALVLPISIPPVIKKSKHRSPVVAINQLIHIGEKSDDKNDQDDDDDEDVHGVYLTASKDGMVRFWSLQLEPIRADYSRSCFLNMNTWILAIEALPDVNIVCTSSTERELRFHDTMASTFSLRVVIRSMPHAVCCMAYAFHPNGKGISRLCLGDYAGTVRILEFSPYLRGPFKIQPGTERVDLYWTDIKNNSSDFKYREYINYHSELIHQIHYSLRFTALLACAEYRNTKKYHGRCPGLIMTSSNEQTIFKIPLGVTAFALEESIPILATGGPDTYLRLWDPYIPHKPSALLTGHNGGIIKIFIQSSENKVYSIDYLRVIKVWQIRDHTLLQTYGDLAQLLAEETDLTFHYNKNLRQLMIGGRKLLTLKCSPRMRIDLTDGNTHAGSVSVVLYNRLFRNLVTCGLDSYIIVWDPWNGTRQIILKNCHTKMVNGARIDVEITAACFDPLEQFLLTGARDGSLKVWNYNNAVCVRNMRIKEDHEVTAVAWIVDRIFATGWDRKITEFTDAEGRGYGEKKDWPVYHNDDVICSDLKNGEGIATASSSGELILWRLETGQPYRKFNVSEPNKFVELIHKKNYRAQKKVVKKLSTRYSPSSRESISKRLHVEGDTWAKTSLKASFYLKNIDEPFDQKNEENSKGPLSAQALLFLQTRPMSKVHGSLFVALDNGRIQVYSHHQQTGYMTSFNAIHKAGDCVLTMATDSKNRYLFTGTALGYVKLWHIENYCIPEEEHTKVNMSKMRLQFIFLWKERLLTKVKRAIRNQPEPMLLNSYKGHPKSIITMAFINQSHILITGSHDYSCRLWTLGGRYLGTLGSPLPWKKISPFERIDETGPYRLPADIKKIASSTTLKVISGIYVDNVKQLREEMKAEENTDDIEENVEVSGDLAQIYTKPLKEPILGKHFKMPERVASIPPAKLDTTFSYIPVYTHLNVYECEQLNFPKTPEVIKKTKEKDFMDYFQTKNFKEGGK